MAAVVALLRAVNVGGTGKLPMSDLKEICVAEGYSKVQTFIASGNVVFETKASPARIKAALEVRLKTYAGKPVGVLVRTADEMISVLKSNPFPKAAPNRTIAIFLDQPPEADALDDLRHLKDEELRLGAREIYVHYGDGMCQHACLLNCNRRGHAHWNERRWAAHRTRAFSAGADRACVRGWI